MSSAFQRYRESSLGVKILLFMGIGLAAGLVFGERAQAAQPLGDLFIRLLVMAAIPLIFFNLLAGLTSLDDIRVLGRLGTKTFLFYLATTVFAFMLGLAAIELLQPGVSMSLTEELDEAIGAVPSVLDLLLDLVPQNAFEAFSAGNVSQILVFALLLGVATLLLPEEKRQVLRDAFELLAALLRSLVDLILEFFGPIGIGALAAATVGQYGAAIFGPLAVFITGVWGAHIVMVGVYLALLYGFTHYSPMKFLKKTGPLYATTAATCSSLASLAVSFEMVRERLRLPEHIYSFTLPLGAQFHKDGTSIMLGGVLLFTSQAAGFQFDLATLPAVVLVGVILSAGSGGIPAGGLVIALIYVQAFNLPVEIAAIVGGVYRLIDMGNTTVNMMGDVVGTVIIAKTEGFSPEEAIS